MFCSRRSLTARALSRPPEISPMALKVFIENNFIRLEPLNLLFSDRYGSKKAKKVALFVV